MTNMIGMVQSAIKASAPVVGIPIPGQPPFCVKRSLLKESLRGMDIIEAAIQLPLDSDNGTPYLQIYATAGKVKGIRKFVPLSPYTVKRLLADWVETKREAVLRTAAPRGRYAKHIAKLERAIAKVGRLDPPRHPIANPYHCESNVRGCEQWAKWKSEARLRNQLWHIANKGYHGKPQTSQKLYTDAKALGVTPKTYSSYTAKQKERLGIRLVSDYLLSFYEHCGLTPKPYGFKSRVITTKAGDNGWTPADCGPEHYERWLRDIRQVKALRSEIEAVKEMQHDT